MNVAFVDVDGTLTRTNISFLFGYHMYINGKVSLLKALFCAFLYAGHVLGVVQVAKLHRTVCRLVFQGKKRADVLAWAEQFFALNRVSLFRSSMIEEIEMLRRQNISTVLLSSSPDFLVSFVARACGGLEYQATEYVCSDEGSFSHIGNVMSGMQKGRVALEYRKRGCNTISAFTDSLQDKPLLEVSDEVSVVCPGWSLKRLARKRGWRVIPG